MSGYRFWVITNNHSKRNSTLKNADELKMAKWRYQMPMIRRSWQRDINTGCSGSNTWISTKIKFLHKVRGLGNMIVLWDRSERQAANPNSSSLRDRKLTSSHTRSSIERYFHCCKTTSYFKKVHSMRILTQNVMCNVKTYHENVAMLSGQSA